MTLAECRPLNARCRRRRLRVAAMKLPCSFWFLLLFGAGGLVLFIHLQDLSEMVQQQAPGSQLVADVEVKTRISTPCKSPGPRLGIPETNCA
ncbi:hypothetical protein SKAU_G00352670 [Synaphobranchus kaupii]|uniref:Uncharacterized protein n=1 Tax=Synaphobranchus kaupii TaxID=118154 RepID=A0A9Q1IIC9_SYNKA|nr:hypothetical protein SKAU_G00352670 [Synaphobranchus kaupii]